MAGLRSIHDSTSKSVLDLLETGLRLMDNMEFIVERNTVTKFGVDDRGSNGTCS